MLAELIRIKQVGTAILFYAVMLFLVFAIALLGCCVLTPIILYQKIKGPYKFKNL